MNGNDSQATLVADLGYGDAGKGSMVDYLTRLHGAHTVVRYNGGAQAAHNVVASDGRHHTFAQFGSGTLVPGTRTHLSRFMLVNPLAMLGEERHLQNLGIVDAFARMSIDREAPITTPFQTAANRLKEIARGDGRHGSCGMGIGETMSDYLEYGSQVLFASDLSDCGTVVRKLNFLRKAKLDQLGDLLDRLPENDQAKSELQVLQDPEVVEYTADLYQHFSSLVEIVDGAYLGGLLQEPGTVIFEGAQGVLLDEWYGFHPYTTWSTTTFKNADTLLAESGHTGQVTKLGLIRAYATRHGAGPFVTEDEGLTAALPDWHNGNNPWQRQFRVGYFDLVATRYALEVVGHVDCLAVTNLDRLAELPEWKTCQAYQYDGREDDLASYFEAKGSTIRRIKLPQPEDLVHQEQLTGRLFDCNPICHTFNSTLEAVPVAYVSMLGQELGLPVAILSAGPTASEKQFLESWERLT